MPTVLGNQFMVIDHPLVDYMKALLPEEASRLMSFYIPVTGTWSIGIWINRDIGEVKELLSLHNDQPITRDHVDTIRFNLLPHKVAGAIREWLQKARDKTKRIVAAQVNAEQRFRDNRSIALRKNQLNKEDPRCHTFPWDLLP